MLKIPSIANRQALSHRDVNLGAGTKSISPRESSDNKEASSDDQEGDGQIPPMALPDNESIPSDSQTDYDQILSEIILIYDDNSAERTVGVEGTPQVCNIFWSKICLFEETGEKIYLFNRNGYKVSAFVVLMT